MVVVATKLEAGSLEWLELVHQDLVSGAYSKATRALEVAIEKRKSSNQRETMKPAENPECPDCWGSGFKPTGPERNAPHVKCDHQGKQPMLKAAADEDMPF